MLIRLYDRVQTKYQLRLAKATKDEAAARKSRRAKGKGKKKAQRKKKEHDQDYMPAFVYPDEYEYDSSKPFLGLMKSHFLLRVSASWHTHLSAR